LGDRASISCQPDPCFNPKKLSKYCDDNELGVVIFAFDSGDNADDEGDIRSNRVIMKLPVKTSIGTVGAARIPSYDAVSKRTPMAKPIIELALQ
jgi:hypothetical protein